MQPRLRSLNYHIHTDYGISSIENSARQVKANQNYGYSSVTTTHHSHFTPFKGNMFLLLNGCSRPFNGEILNRVYNLNGLIPVQIIGGDCLSGQIRVGFLFTFRFASQILLYERFVNRESPQGHQKHS